MDDAQAHRQIVAIMTPTFRAAERAARGIIRGQHTLEEAVQATVAVYIQALAAIGETLPPLHRGQTQDHARTMITELVARLRAGGNPRLAVSTTWRLPRQTEDARHDR
jgi:hypothetical protein